jgi:plasmid stability protein
MLALMQHHVDASPVMLHCEIMKNITVSVDDDTYRRARIRAAAEDVSVSAVVRDFLTKYAATETEFERLKREEQVLRERIESFRASDRVSRDEIHVRR